MNIENVIENQKQNTFSAYKRTDYDYSISILGRVVTQGLTSKQSIIDKLGDSVVFFPRDYTQEELISNSYTLKDLVLAHPEYSFSLASKTVTERGTGKCRPIKKLLEEKGWHDPSIESVMRQCEQKRQLFIAAHPWFLIGSSVSANGHNVESSCHHPGSSTKDYKSGPISYARDNCTIVFGLWDEIHQGMSGRQLVYVDRAAGIITTRLYGHITEGDSSHLRKELYKLLMPEVPVSAWKKTKDINVCSDDYCGYLDDDYFMGYRPSKALSIEVCLTNPICPSCGDEWHEGYLLCGDCFRRGGEKCSYCSDSVYEGDEYYSPDGEIVCESCFDERYFLCHKCGETYRNNEKCTEEGSHNHYCRDCAERRGMVECEDCEKWTQDYYVMVDGSIVCEECLPSDAVSCAECCNYERERYMTKTIEGDFYCSDCDGNVDLCVECKSHTNNGLTVTVNGDEVCDACVTKFYPHVCPGCGLAQEGESVCSDDCAATNLFKMAA